MSHFAVFLFSLFPLSNGIEVIDDVWHDDFTVDPQGSNGWYIYYKTYINPLDYAITPFINGSMGKYHGVYQNNADSVHYLQRTFQCKNDSSIRLGYTMAFCGNQQNDKTQVHLGTAFKFVIDFSTLNRLYSFIDNDITSAHTCGGYSWQVYYDTHNANVLQSFISAQVSFDLKIEVELSTADDKAVINNITIFCDPPLPTTEPTSIPTVSPISPTVSPVISPTLSPTSSAINSNMITDVWYDDFVYDSNGTYGWDKFYMSGQLTTQFLYTPDKNPLISGDYTYHGIYKIYQFKLRHILYRLFQCQNPSEVIVQYSVVYCGNTLEDHIEVQFNGVDVSSIQLGTGAAFNDTNVINKGSNCTFPWIHNHFVKSIGITDARVQFELQFKYRLSLVGEFGALYNISIRCDPTTALPTNTPTMTPTTSNPTSAIPTDAPSTVTPTSANPTTNAPTSAHPTTNIPTTFVPTTANPTSFIPTTFIPTTANPTTSIPTTLVPTAMYPTTNAPTSAHPTTNIPTTLAPTTSNPTSFIPTTFIPTTANPTTSIPTTLVPTSMYPTTMPTHMSDGIVNGETTLSNTEMALNKESHKDNTLIFIIIIGVTVFILLLIGCVVFYKIYKKKQVSKTDETECISQIQMNTNTRTAKDKNIVITGGNTNKSEFDSQSDNSIEGIYDKPIISVSTKGETTEGGTSADFMKDDTSDVNEDSIVFTKQSTKEMIDDNTQTETDGSDTEEMFDNTPNITKGGNEKTTERYIPKAQSQTTKGNGDGNNA